MKRKIVAILLSLGMLCPALSTGARAVEFGDISGHWAESAIRRWGTYNIVTGDERGFRPNDTMTRAEAAAVKSPP